MFLWGLRTLFLPFIANRKGSTQGRKTGQLQLLCTLLISASSDFKRLTGAAESTELQQRQSVYGVAESGQTSLCVRHSFADLSL